MPLLGVAGPLTHRAAEAQEARDHKEGEDAGSAAHELRCAPYGARVGRSRQIERDGRVVELWLKPVPRLLAGRKALLESDRADNREVRVVRLVPRARRTRNDSGNQRRSGNRGCRRRPRVKMCAGACC
jgi:hypothetical protein